CGKQAVRATTDFVDELTHEAILPPIGTADKHVVEVGVSNLDLELSQYSGIGAVDVAELLHFPLREPSATGIRLVDEAVDVGSQCLLLGVLGLKNLFGSTAHRTADVR